MKKFFLFSLAIFLLSSMSYAQRPVTSSTPTPAIMAKDTYEARYEGGLFGASDREDGLLKFDDANERVIFSHKKDQKEMFSIPYEALVVIYPDSKVNVSKTGNVVSRLPLPGAGLASLLSKRTKYLIVNFDDPEIEAKGTANFKFDEKEELLNFISVLGQKAKMVQRGDAYYRGKKGTNVF